MTRTVGPMFSDQPGDTPLRDVPSDYACGGQGRWFLLPEGPDAGRRMYYWERQHGEGPGPTILLVHGNPECSYTYRKLARALDGTSLPSGTRIIAMDHLGFGRSDQASFEMVEMHHAANLQQLVKALDLRNVTLVVHDWGGPIGLGAFLEEPGRLANLVVLNSTIFPIPPDGLTYANYPIPILLPWVRTASLVPDRLWGINAAFAVALTPTHAVGILGEWIRTLIKGSLGFTGPGAAALRTFHQQFDSKINAQSSKRLVRQTPVWGHGYAYQDRRMGPQSTHEFYRALQARVTDAWGPDGRHIGVAGVFGAWDPLAKPSVLAQWRRALPQIDGNLQVFDGVSHFVEEHRPDEIADAVLELVG